MARKVADLNASSQADIAFLLLIFFLVTTSMDVDQGLSRQLPPPATDEKSSDKVNERNVLVVLINKDNQLAIEGELSEIRDLKDRTKEFLMNVSNNPNLAEKVPVSEKLQKAQAAQKEDDIKLYMDIQKKFGDIGMTKGIVSLQNDRGTRYETYIQVQNEIVAAYNEVRDQLSKQYYGGRLYDELNQDEQKLVKTVYPLSISEAEPRSIK